MYSLDDTDELGANAPKPIDTGSIDRGAFETLSHNDGAMRARREPRRSSNGRSSSAARHDAGSRPSSGQVVRLSRRTLIGLCVAACLVIALCVTLFVRVLSAPVPGSEELTNEAALAGEQTEAANAEITYELRENNGSYSLVELRPEGDGQGVVVGNLPGQPVDLIMYEGTALVPENLSDGTWEVSAYTIDGSWTPIAKQDGTAVGGKGVISEASLDGAALRLVVDGAEVSVPLEW